MDTNAPNLSVVLMGKATSGKGTQAKALHARFGGMIFSVGAHVRELIKEDTPLGRRVRDTYESGKLIPEWLASYWVTDILLSVTKETLLICEAIARKPNEARLFDEIHEWIERSYIVFYLDIPDSVVYERSAHRERDALDATALVSERLKEFKTHTTASLAFFRERGTLIEIDGTEPVEVVTETIAREIDGRLSSL